MFIFCYSEKFTTSDCFFKKTSVGKGIQRVDNSTVVKQLMWDIKDPVKDAILLIWKRHVMWVLHIATDLVTGLWSWFRGGGELKDFHVC